MILVNFLIKSLFYFLRMVGVDFRDEQISICLNHENSGAIRIQALFELMNLADERSLDALFDVLRNDPCELVRHEAAFVLGECISYKSIDVLRRVYENDDSLVVKHECLMSLGTIGRQEDIDFIKEKIDDKRFEVSCSAKIAIDRINQEDDFEDFEDKIDYYIEKLADQKNTTQNERIQVLFHLMNVADVRSVDAIGKCLLEDICRVVRHEAGFVLGEIATDKAIYYLKEGVENDKTAIVVHECLFALGTTANREVLEFLEKYVDDKNYVISESARIAIDRIEKIQNPYRGPEHFEYLK